MFFQTQCLALAFNKERTFFEPSRDHHVLTNLGGNDAGWQPLREQTRQAVLPELIDTRLNRRQQQQRVGDLGGVQHGVHVSALRCDEGEALLEARYAATASQIASQADPCSAKGRGAATQ